jgi:hypothetical protein
MWGGLGAGGVAVPLTCGDGVPVAELLSCWMAAVHVHPIQIVRGGTKELVSFSECCCGATRVVSLLEGQGHSTLCPAK